MLFVSAKRPTHAQPQVYERDLNTGLERRITFQNGSTSHPRYQPLPPKGAPDGNWIVYSSTTDELKELPPLLNLGIEKPSKLPAPYLDPSEVYAHSLNGLEIQRITTQPGYDGEARFSHDGRPLLTWTRVHGDRTLIMIAPRAERAAARPLAGLGDNPTAYTVSPDGKSSAWIEWDKSFGVSRLRVRQGKDTADIASDMIVTKADPEFSPDSKWLLWSQRDPQSGLYSIWGYELATKCLQHFSFPSEADRRDPVVSPGMKWLTYTLNKGGRSRIAQVPFVQRTGPCPASP